MVVGSIVYVYIEYKLLQPPNAASPIFSTELGMRSSLRESQSEKALESIVFKVSGKFN